MRPFNPQDPPRRWILELERPPMWPEPIPVKLRNITVLAMAESGVIYRFYDANGELIYLGQASGDPTNRWRAHRKEAAWWCQAAFVSIAHVTPVRKDRMALERDAIRSERPRFNKQYNVPRVHLDVRLDMSPAGVVDQFRAVLLPDDFAALVAAFAAEHGQTGRA